MYSESEKLNKKIVGDETWTALQAIDKDGTNSLRVQIAPNDKNVYLYQTATGINGYKYVGRLVNVEDIGTLYWSNLESIAIIWSVFNNKKSNSNLFLYTDTAGCFKCRSVEFDKYYSDRL